MKKPETGVVRNYLNRFNKYSRQKSEERKREIKKEFLKRDWWRLSKVWNIGFKED